MSHIWRQSVAACPAWPSSLRSTKPTNDYSSLTTVTLNIVQTPTASRPVEFTSPRLWCVPKKTGPSICFVEGRPKRMRRDSCRREGRPRLAATCSAALNERPDMQLSSRFAVHSRTRPCVCARCLTLVGGLLCRAPRLPKTG